MLLPLVASALVIFGAPYIGQVRATLQSAFPEHYQAIVGGIVVVAVVGAIVAALTRIRRQQDGGRPHRTHQLPLWVRYALIASALAIAGTYARLVRTGNLDVDLVEGFHFVEYGLITYLYYRVWRGRSDVAAIVLPACAALIVGIADEGVQWFVPGRVGEMHDVLLDAAAIGCGLLFSVAIHPWISLRRPQGLGGRLALGIALSALVIAVATFVDRVHLGHEIVAADIGVFRSQFEADALDRAAADRATRWQTSPPPQNGLTREDQYLSEGRWHLQERNLAESAGDMWVAWNENRILERFFSPVLDGPHIAGGNPTARWSSEQLSRITQRAEGVPHAPFVSDAAPYPLYVIRRSTLWLLTMVLVTAVMMAAAVRRERSNPVPVS